MIKKKKRLFEKSTEESVVVTSCKSNLNRRKIKTIRKELSVVARAGDYYKTADGDFMEILKIDGTSGIKRFTRQAYEMLIADYTAGLRTLTQAFNTVILDFLVNHQAQIDFYYYKIDQLDLSNPTDQVKHYWLMQEIQKLEYRQFNATEEQYFLLLFSESLDHLETLIGTAFEIPYINLKKLSRKSKDAFIYKMNNLNSSPYNLLRGDLGD